MWRGHVVEEAGRDERGVDRKAGTLRSNPWVLSCGPGYRLAWERRQELPQILPVPEHEGRQNHGGATEDRK